MSLTRFIGGPLDGEWRDTERAPYIQVLEGAPESLWSDQWSIVISPRLGRYKRGRYVPEGYPPDLGVWAYEWCGWEDEEAELQTQLDRFDSESPNPFPWGSDD